MDTPNQDQSELVQLTADIISAYVSNNNVGLTSPLVREAIAAALIAGAGAAAAVFAGHGGSSGKKQIRSSSSLLSDATQNVTDAAVGALRGPQQRRSRDCYLSQKSETQNLRGHLGRRDRSQRAGHSLPARG
jgi:hypothetical protein